MTITKSVLVERKQVLEAQRTQLVANVHATEGAIQALTQLITDLDAEEAKAPAKAK